jgi:AcrR family transcriptional regulator
MKGITKKEKFLAITLQLIHEKGFKATTLRDIAQKLNFEVANVYNYIDSKQALLEAYLFDISDEFHKAQDRIIDSTYSSREKVQLMIASYIQITAKRPYEQALLVNEWRNLKEPRRQEFMQRRKDYEDKLMAVLQEGVDQGQFRVLDVELTAHTLLASLRWLYKKHIDEAKAINPIEIEKQLTDFIFLGILKN